MCVCVCVCVYVCRCGCDFLCQAVSTGGKESARSPVIRLKSGRGLRAQQYLSESPARTKPNVTKGDTHEYRRGYEGLREWGIKHL